MDCLKTDYVLDNVAEFKRLEDQALQSNYSIPHELRYLNIKPNSHILDAGCGSGVLSKYLAQSFPEIKIHACDYSQIRIDQARRENTFENITFTHAKLEDLPFQDGMFDIVISRFVFEYLHEPVLVAQRLSRLLKPNGILYLVDLDGVFVNFWTSNKRFNSLLNKLHTEIDFDLCVGRKLPSYLSQAGLRDINWDITVHPFFDTFSVEQERENNYLRLIGAREKFEPILKEHIEYNEFIQMYLNEMDNIVSKKNVMFFNKFIAWGMK